MTDVTAGEAVTAAIRQLVREFDDTEPAALAAEADGVHQHRTVVRRLRSVLRVFRDVFEPSAAAHLRGSLKEWGNALGVVRDHEVAAGLAEALLVDVPAASEDSRVAARLVDPEREAGLSAHRRLIEIHGLERMHDTRRLLHTFASDPPLSVDAAAPAVVIRETLVATAGRVRRSARHAHRSLESRHELRKRARRLRHAIEAMMSEPPGMFGRRMQRVAKVTRRIQSELGDHRDAQLLITKIERARILAARAGEDVRVYDELTAKAHGLADTALHELRAERERLAEAIAALEA